MKESKTEKRLQMRSAEGPQLHRTAFLLHSLQVDFLSCNERKIKAVLGILPVNTSSLFARIENKIMTLQFQFI